MNQGKTRALEARIATIAARQHGIVTRTQLLEIGLTPRMVKIRIEWEHLRPVHRGIYLLGTLTGRLEPGRAREMAALLACGPGAALSHESAAMVGKLLDGEWSRDLVHVTIPGADRGRRPGIRPHKVKVLRPEDATVIQGLRVTTPARTLVDLAGRVDSRTLEQAFAQAERLEIASRDDVAAVLERRPRAPGIDVLRRLIVGPNDPAFTRSVAEERLLKLIGEVGLPRPETNVKVGKDEVDALWRAERVVVEVDGFRHHSSRSAFERDRQRDARLAALGFQVVRVTWRQLTNEPHKVLVRLAEILTAARVRM